MTQMLKVLPNPERELDAKGRPCCAVPWDPIHHSALRRWVGAEPTITVIEKEITVTVAGKKGRIKPAKTDVTWKFSSVPVEVPNSGYYRDHVRKGALLAADAETARLCGVKLKKVGKEPAPPAAGGEPPKG